MCTAASLVKVLCLINVHNICRSLAEAGKGDLDRPECGDACCDSPGPAVAHGRRTGRPCIGTFQVSIHGPKKLLLLVFSVQSTGHDCKRHLTADMGMSACNRSYVFIVDSWLYEVTSRSTAFRDKVGANSTSGACAGCQHSQYQSC